MAKLSELFEQAGARADGVNAFTRELLENLDARISALEAFSNPVTRASAPASGKLKSAVKAAAQTLETALADETSTDAAPAAPAAS